MKKALFVKGAIAVVLSALVIAGVVREDISPWWLLSLIALGAWGSGFVTIGATVEVKKS